MSKIIFVCFAALFAVCQKPAHSIPNLLWLCHQRLHCWKTTPGAPPVLDIVARWHQLPGMNGDEGVTSSRLADTTGRGRL